MAAGIDGYRFTAFDRSVALCKALEAHPVQQETDANLYLMRTLAEWLWADDEAAATDSLVGWRMCVTEQPKMPEIYRKFGVSNRAERMSLWVELAGRERAGRSLWTRSV